MIRLLLETATDVCSVAVARGARILAEKTAAEPYLHSSHLTLFISEVLDKAAVEMSSLDEVVLSDGPGSYTSLRVGAATAKGLCVALPDLRLRVVPTLLALAAASPATGTVLATIPSRRGEVYGQLFAVSHGPAAGAVTGDGERAIPAKPVPLTEPLNIRLRDDSWPATLPFSVKDQTLIVLGPGQDRVRESFGDDIPTVRIAGPRRCAAAHLLAPASWPDDMKGGDPPTGGPRHVDVATYEPFYLNPPFVTQSKKKILGR